MKNIDNVKMDSCNYISNHFPDLDGILSILIESLKNEKISNSILLKNKIESLYKKIITNPMLYYQNREAMDAYLEKMKTEFNNFNEHPEEHKYLRRFTTYINLLYRMFVDNNITPIDYNSEKYYTLQINELQERENKLNEELSRLKQKTAEHLEKEKELNIIKEQIKQNIVEKEELKKKLDARDNLKERISTAFNELKNHVSHLEKEEKRLNWMFYIYAILCGFVLIILMYFEYSYLSKWINSENTTWIDYAPFYIPVPIVGGLLWAFIFQMNRAQRQLMQVANVLYHIDYVEGLLLAINLISSDVNSASEKICNVLDSLIKNYMSIPDSLSEQSLDKAISKDNINLHTFINLAKEVKEVIK